MTNIRNIKFWPHAIALGVTLVAVCYMSRHTAHPSLSFYLGFCALCLPTMLFLRMTLRKNHNPRNILQRFYLGGGLKFVSLLLLVGGMFSFLSVIPGWFFAGFVFAQNLVWFIMFKHRCLVL